MPANAVEQNLAAYLGSEGNNCAECVPQRSVSHAFQGPDLGPKPLQDCAAVAVGC